MESNEIYEEIKNSTDAASKDASNTTTVDTEKPELIKSNIDGKFLSITGDTAIHFQMDKNKSVNEQAEDLVNLAAVAKAVKDVDLVEKITECKKEELNIKAETQVKEKTINSKQAERKLQEVNYGIYAGIADLIGLKKPLPNGMLKILMLILTPVLIGYYLVIGLIAGLINITMDCVNSIVTRFAEFTKPARQVIKFLLIVLAIIIVLLVIYRFLTQYGIIKPFV